MIVNIVEKLLRKCQKNLIGLFVGNIGQRGQIKMKKKRALILEGYENVILEDALEKMKENNLDDGTLQLIGEITLNKIK